MQVHNVEQGTDEWLELRLGIPTASEFSKLVTPTGRNSKSIDPYAKRLAAELYAGKPLDGYTNDWMERGNELEDAARAAYEFETDRTVEQVGFITDDQCGCSPDGLIDDDGLIEIKCPSAHVHVDNMLNGLDSKYFPQIQGQLLVSDRMWCDFVSYHPDLPLVVERIHRDNEFIESLRAQIISVVEKRDLILETIQQKYSEE